MNLLIPNLGSTSLKYQILEMPSETVLAKGRMQDKVKSFGWTVFVEYHITAGIAIQGLARQVGEGVLELTQRGNRMC